MAIFTPDPTLRYYLETFDPWSGHEVCRSTDDRDEALAWFEQARSWGVSSLWVTDTLKGVTIAQHEGPKRSTARARW